MNCPYFPVANGVNYHTYICLLYYIMSSFILCQVPCGTEKEQKPPKCRKLCRIGSFCRHGLNSKVVLLTTSYSDVHPKFM